MHIREEAGIVGVASIADATRIGRNGQVVEMDQTEEFIYTWLDLLEAPKLEQTMDLPFLLRFPHESHTQFHGGCICRLFVNRQDFLGGA